MHNFFCGKKKRLSGNYRIFARRNVKSTIMEEKNTAKRPNLILNLLKCKRELRECIQNGANHEEMKRIAGKYGFTFATPV